MHLVSVFQHSMYLELALIDLEQIGIPRDTILALPLDKNKSNPTTVQVSHQEGKSYADLLFICGMIGMLLGAIYGFILTLGPVIWGLIGMIVGALIGLLIELLLSGRKVFQRSTIRDVVLIIHCKESQAETVEQILWNHQALGVAKHPVLTSS